MSTYTTGELAKLCGVTVRTVQYYDSRGILAPTELSEGDLTDGKIAVLDLLVISKMAPSKGEARRLIQQGGVLVNDAKVEAIDATVDAAALCGDGIIVRKGKKTYRRFCIK